MRNVKRSLSWLACALMAAGAGAAEPSSSAGATRATLLLDGSNFESFFERVHPLIAGRHHFSGLAYYFNRLDFFVVDNGSLTSVEAGEKLLLEPQQSFVAKGRYEIMRLKAPGLAISIGEEEFEIAAAPPQPLRAEIYSAADPSLREAIPGLDELRYSHLGTPMATLARIVEWSLVGLHRIGVSNWGVAIVVFSVLLKILLLPLSLFSLRLQRQVSRCTTQLAPRLAEIKANYDGEEAHNRIMAAHKDLGVTPFYTLKPLFTALIQVPILVAIFNALGEMPQLSGASFLWIDDLAEPDVIATLPVAIPMFGNVLSLLPFLMTAVTIISTLIFKNRHALAAEMKSQKRNLYLMAAAFFVLFYPFPAGMVLFWTLANILQTMQQQLVKL